MYSVKIKPVKPTKKSKELNLEFFGPLDEETIRNWQKIVSNDMYNIYEIGDMFKTLILTGAKKQ